MDDATARAALTELKGIGPWTADIYLLMALRRTDAWSSGDLALAASVQRVKDLAYRLSSKEWESIGGTRQPWKAIAARILWHFYRSDREDRQSTADVK